MRAGTPEAPPHALTGRGADRLFLESAGLSAARLPRQAVYLNRANAQRSRGFR
jgi:hypothetical protein